MRCRWSVKSVSLAARIAMRPAPASITPWQVPVRMTWQISGDEIEAGRPQWLASAKPRQRHPRARPQSEAADCLRGIYGAGGQMPAFESDKGRKGEAISADQGLRGQPRPEREHSNDAAELLGQMGRSLPFFGARPESLSPLKGGASTGAQDASRPASIKKGRRGAIDEGWYAPNSIRRIRARVRHNSGLRRIPGTGR